MPIRQDINFASTKLSVGSPQSKAKTRPVHIVPAKAAVVTLQMENFATRSVSIAGDCIRLGPFDSQRNSSLALSIRNEILRRLGSTKLPNVPTNSRLS